MSETYVSLPNDEFSDGINGKHDNNSIVLEAVPVSSCNHENECFSCQQLDCPERCSHLNERESVCKRTDASPGKSPSRKSQRARSPAPYSPQARHRSRSGGCRFLEDCSEISFVMSPTTPLSSPIEFVTPGDLAPEALSDWPSYETDIKTRVLIRDPGDSPFPFEPCILPRNEDHYEMSPVNDLTIEETLTVCKNDIEMDESTQSSDSKTCPSDSNASSDDSRFLMGDSPPVDMMSASSLLTCSTPALQVGQQENCRSIKTMSTFDSEIDKDETLTDDAFSDDSSSSSSCRSCACVCEQPENSSSTFPVLTFPHNLNAILLHPAFPNPYDLHLPTPPIVLTPFTTYQHIPKRIEDFHLNKRSENLMHTTSETHDFQLSIEDRQTKHILECLHRCPLYLADQFAGLQAKGVGEPHEDDDNSCTRHSHYYNSFRLLQRFEQVPLWRRFSLGDINPFHNQSEMNLCRQPESQSMFMLKSPNRQLDCSHDWTGRRNSCPNVLYQDSTQDSTPKCSDDNFSSSPDAVPKVDSSSRAALIGRLRQVVERRLSSTEDPSSTVK